MIPLSVQRTGQAIPKNLWLRPARAADRTKIIQLINCVTSEHHFLYTNRYEPNPTWEQLLGQGLNLEEGLLLLIVETLADVVGFIRLSRTSPVPAARSVGDIGIALLPQYRSLGIGTSLLGICIAAAPTLGFTELRADMMAENEIVRRLFRHFNFVMSEPQPTYLPYRQIWIAQITAKLGLNGRWKHALLDPRQTD